MKPTIEIAVSQWEEKKYSLAISTCKDLINSGKETLDCLNILIKSLINKQRNEEALKYLNKATETKPVNVNILCDLANSYTLIGQTVSAKRTYEECLKIDQKNIVALSNLGNIELKLNNTSIALDLHIKAKEANPNIASVRYNLGYTYYQLGKYPEAENEFEKTLELDKNIYQAYLKQSQIHIKNNKLDKAKSVLEKLININPNHTLAYIEISKIFKAQNKLKEAEIILNKSLLFNPNEASTNYYLGDILRCQNKLTESIQYFNKVLEIDPNSYAANLDLGAVLLDLNEFDKALNFSRKANTIQPKNASAKLNIGSIYKRLNKLNEAEVWTREAIKFNPNMAEAHLNLGVILSGNVKVAEAKLSILKCIEINPDFAMAHSMLGHINDALNETDQAKISFKKAFTLNPKNLAIRNNLTMFLLKIKEIKESEVLLKESLEMKPNDPRTNFLFSQLSTIKKEYDNAIAFIETAIKFDETNHIYQGELTRLKFLKGTLDEKENTDLWSDQDDYYFEDNGKHELLIIFSSHGDNNQIIKRFDFYNLLNEVKSFDKLFIRDTQKMFYMRGLMNTTSNLTETIELIKKLSLVKKYTKRIAIGASAGGYAAILYGHLLEFDKAITFNPKTVLKNKKIKEFKDSQFEKISNYLESSKKEDHLFYKCLDLKDLIPFNTDIDIHYSETSEHTIDKNHALHIQDKSCTYFAYPVNHHLLALDLKEKGKLKKIIMEEFLD